MGSAADADRRARSHARIVEKAAKLVRVRGLDGASVETVMGAAGLTRGGFYAHFRDKSEMLAEALDAAFAQSRDNMFSVEDEGLAWVERIAARYLSPAHVEGIASGCSVPALAPEVGRASPKVQAAFARNVERILEEMAQRLAEGEVTDADRAEAVLLFSTWVGALTLARALGAARSSAVLSAARAGAVASARARRSAPPAAPSRGSGPEPRTASQPGAASKRGDGRRRAADAPAWGGAREAPASGARRRERAARG